VISRIRDWLLHEPEQRLMAFVLAPVLPLLLTLLLLLTPQAAVLASPGICVGPVCGDQFERSETYDWLLRLRVSDQQGRHERLAIDCRGGDVTPLEGPVERGYATAVARRACRFTAEAAA